MNPPERLDPEAPHYWENGWDEHERLQLLRLARLPLADKLKWLEEAHRIVRHLAAAKSIRPQDPARPGRPQPPRGGVH